MSERGSFVTEYIYCSRCFEAAKAVLLGRAKHLCATTVPGWSSEEELPIIAGKVGGMYAGEEIDAFSTRYTKELAPRLCHPLRIAVLAETGEHIFTVTPQ
jgi:hypothetical protein